MTMSSMEPDIELQKVCAAGETPCKETSPDSKCPICLDRFRNVSYADKCFHRFCFRCILEWGKNKAECPLCKQPFGAVYHSVRSEHDFKVYELRPAENGSFGSVQGQRFRYRTTLTHERHRAGRTRGGFRQQEVMRFRRWLYRCDVRVHGVRDGGRSRDTSAEFFRKNPACLHRLVPWLKREMAVLYGSHDSVADVVLRVILSLITRHDIQDEAFLRELRPFLSSRTEHFLHEFLSFARSPFNMEAYDRHAVYDCPAPSHLSAVSEDDGDLSSAPSPWDDETPGPSYSSATNSAFTVTISDSDADSASEEEEEAESVGVDANNKVTNSRADEDDYSSDRDCVIVGFIKPTAQRTPELVQLSSDSEASVQEAPEPSTSYQSDLRDLTNQRNRNKDVLSHSTTKHTSNRRGRSRERGRERDFSKHSHRQRSCSLSYKDKRKRSKATNHSSWSHTYRHSRNANTDYSRDMPQRSHAHLQCKNHSCSRSKTLVLSWSSACVSLRSRSRARSRSRSRARSRSRSRARSRSRSRARSRSRSRARSRSRSRARSRSRSRARSRSRSRARSRSRSRARSRSRSRARSRSRSRARSRSRSRARSRSRSRARSRSRSRARSRSRSRARSRSRSRARSRSRSRARSRSRSRARSRSRSRARSRSRSRVYTYSGSWGTQSSFRYRKQSECLSVSPAHSLNRRSSHDKACGKQKHQSLHRERRKCSKDKRHHKKKKKKTRSRRRLGSSTEVGAERRKHHKKKKKHKTERKNRSERMGRSLKVRSHAVITIHTDEQPAEGATPPEIVQQQTQSL